MSWLPRETADDATELVSVVDIAARAKRNGERAVDLECLLTQALHGQHPRTEAEAVAAIGASAVRLLEMATAYTALCAERREADRGAA